MDSCKPDQNSSIMHNGNGVSDISDEESYDIGPDEVRLPLYTDDNNGQPLIPVQMTSGTRETVEGGSEIKYEQAYVPRQHYGIFFEPQDETPPEHDFRSHQERNYYSEKNRLATFLDKWLNEYHVRPDALARNGFIFAGHSDRVKCVFCLNFLQGWDIGDTVEGEHRRHYPDCPFVLGQADHLNIPLPCLANMKQENAIAESDEANNLSRIVEKIREDLTIIIYLSEAEMQLIVDANTRQLAQSLRRSSKVVETLQEFCQRQIDRQADLKEALELIQLYKLISSQR